MKKILSLLMVLLMLPFSSPALSESAAREITVEIHTANDKPADAAPLCDGNDETGLSLKKGKEGSVILLLPEDHSCAALTVRLSASPSKAELQQQNEKKKWETVTSVSNPGIQFNMNTSGLAGKVRLVLTFSPASACMIQELRCFTAGTLPDFAHEWQSAAEADILLAAETIESINLSTLADLVSAGHTVAVAALGASGSVSAVWDSLWDAGLRSMPLLYVPASKKTDFSAVLASWIRSVRPLLLVTDDTLASHAEAAVSNAADPSWDIESAAVNGIWALPDLCGFSEVSAHASSLSERNNDAIRAWCISQFKDAQHADPATIPYPETRLEDGYLPEGEAEFIYDDAENGLWAYLSQTLQVEIIKYHVPEVPHTWFEANVIFKPEAESFTQHVYVNATFPGQQIYPETLAQTSQLVFAVNGDYYPNRASKKWPTGNIIRRREVLYEYDAKGSLKFPNLDTLAIRDDGSFSVYTGSEISASELLAQGDVHDALSFGPYLVRNDVMRIYNGNSADVPEPRCAYGMVKPGHLFFVMVEGKMPKKGEQGFNLWQLAELMYARGCTEAMNVDGGSTAVMLFMGRKLNRTGKATTLGSPRNQHELFGIGTSSRVYTDMADGKKKKK